MKTDDFKTMAKILYSVKVCERQGYMDKSQFAEEVLGVDNQTRDSLIISLQRDGYVDGFNIIDDIDNMKYPVVMIDHSLPRITVKGLEYIEESKPLKKAIKALRDMAIEVAKSKLLGMMF